MKKWGQRHGKKRESLTWQVLHDATRPVINTKPVTALIARTPVLFLSPSLSLSLALLNFNVSSSSAARHFRRHGFSGLLPCIVVLLFFFPANPPPPPIFFGFLFLSHFNPILLLLLLSLGAFSVLLTSASFSSTKFLPRLLLCVVDLRKTSRLVEF
jgi:hypothetical protein